MSDTSGLPNTDGLGVPVEDDPERFEGGGGRGRHVAEPAEDAQGQGDADHGGEGAEPPPADFDPTEHPTNPDLVNNPEPPDE